MASIKRSLALWAAGGTLFSAGAALSEAPERTISFPPSLAAVDVGAWLPGETGIPARQVIALSPSAAVAALAITPAAAPPGRRLVLRAQALDPQVVRREGLLAWDVTVEADCAARKVRVGETTGYSDRRPSGPGVLVKPAEEDWRTPPAASVLESAWRRACDAAFEGPLGSAPAVRPALEPKLRAASAEDAGSPAASHQALPPRGGAFKVQVVAAPSAREAQGVLARLPARSAAGGAGLMTEVARASVGGRVVYRGLVAGFARSDEAARFCDALRVAGRDCFLRRTP